jgi:hypothetical protein
MACAQGEKDFTKARVKTEKFTYFPKKERAK